MYSHITLHVSDAACADHLLSWWTHASLCLLPELGLSSMTCFADIVQAILAQAVPVETICWLDGLAVRAFLLC